MRIDVINKQVFVRVIAIAVVVVASQAVAGNVDLVTLPNRETVELTIYNSEDLTLVKERRFVTLKEGHNQLRFSWAGTLIDPTSVELRPVENRDAIDVIDTVMSASRPDQLMWNVNSDEDGQVLMEVSYFTSGLTWQMDYVAIANTEETELDLTGYMRIFNNSGEEYEDAKIRLIVGKINLVEKIAALSKLSGLDDDDSAKDLSRIDRLTRTRVGQKVVEEILERDLSVEEGTIIKEGLSEYFIFNLPRTSTVKNGWSKRMPAIEAAAVEFDIVYRMRQFQYGPRPVRFFKWMNDAEHKLGDSPMPDGRVRVFRQNAQGGLSIQGTQLLNYVPIQAAIEVNLGPDDLVVYQRRRTATRRSDFTFHATNKNVIGWNETQQWEEVIRNYRSEPIQFELRLRMDGDVEVVADHNASSIDFNTVEVKMEVPAAGSVKYPHTDTVRHQNNAKQNRVVIKQ
ncbi:MAG: hypothetical protein ACI9HK_003503 [Pirellulaceae bacterium]|jgi:hypothetical protein